jgi:hypothetical protein
MLPPKGDMLLESLLGQGSSKRRLVGESKVVMGMIKLRSGRLPVAMDWERERETLAGAMGGEYCAPPGSAC